MGELFSPGAEQRLMSALGRMPIEVVHRQKSPMKWALPASSTRSVGRQVDRTLDARLRCNHQRAISGSNPVLSASQSARWASFRVWSEKGRAMGPFFRPTTTGERVKYPGIPSIRPIFSGP